MFCFFLSSALSTEEVRKELKSKYLKHTALSYKTARIQMYNDVDCQNDQLHLIYGGNSISWKCGGKSIPQSTVVNAEHIIPQSFFNSKSPMVSDLHHLISSPAKLNGKRSNFKYAEFSYDLCEFWCKDNDCSLTRPSNPDQYSCLSKKNQWMPRKDDRGEVARAVLYWFTVYDDKGVSMDRVGDLQTFINWANTYPPSDREVQRNKLVEKVQGNLNPYIVDPSLVDKAWP